MKKSYDCILCPNKYEEFEDLIHHLQLEHVGISSKLLDESTKSRETKKQLGDYVNIEKKGVGIECPTCFEKYKDLIEQ